MYPSEVLSGWRIVRENEFGDAMIEYNDLCYIVRVDGRNYQFKSALPCDAPGGGGCWVAPWTETGLGFVASGRSRHAAHAQWRKYIEPLAEMWRRYDAR